MYPDDEAAMYSAEALMEEVADQGFASPAEMFEYEDSLDYQVVNA